MILKIYVTIGLLWLIVGFVHLYLDVANGNIEIKNWQRALFFIVLNFLFAISWVASLPALILYSLSRMKNKQN